MTSVHSDIVMCSQNLLMPYTFLIFFFLTSLTLFDMGIDTNSVLSYLTHHHLLKLFSF